jgi:hypothetical protein
MPLARPAPEHPAELRSAAAHSIEDRTCRYCGHTFQSPAQRDAHIPCPDRTYSDTHPHPAYTATRFVGGVGHFPRRGPSPSRDKK